MVYETKGNESRGRVRSSEMILDKTGRVKKQKKREDKEDETDRSPASRGVCKSRETTRK